MLDKSNRLATALLYFSPLSRCDDDGASVSHKSGRHFGQKNVVCRRKMLNQISRIYVINSNSVTESDFESKDSNMDGDE